MPNFATSFPVRRDSDKMSGHRFFITQRVHAPCTAERALVRVSSVVNVLEETTNSVSAGIKVAGIFHKLVAIHIGDEAASNVTITVVFQRIVGHERAEVGAANTDIDDIANTLASISLPLAAAHAIGEIAILSSTLCTSGTTFSPSTMIVSSLGARKATCSTARCSVTLIFSPRNMASMRSRRPDALANSNSRRNVSSVMRFLE